jgi:hypothetical protein
LSIITDLVRAERGIDEVSFLDITVTPLRFQEYELGDVVDVVDDDDDDDDDDQFQKDEMGRRLGRCLVWYYPAR